jgi:DNA-binding NarL/FixJ family response regulator
MHDLIKIIIADDHPIFRKGLRQVIEMDKQLSVIKEASNGEEVLGFLKNEIPDIVVLDLEMPVLDGYETAKKINKDKIEVEIIMLTMHKDEFLFNKLMDIGIKGYILKENAANDILVGIKTVVQGNYYISPGISEYLIRRSGRSTSLPVSHGTIGDLTQAEKKIIKFIAENKTSKEISEILSISYKTVENHRNNICKKLDLKGSNSLLKFAIENRKFL